MIDINEILEFIKRRWSIDCKWHDGNCWWFAYILTTRFPDLEIYYMRISGHFIAGKDNIYFDHRGLIKPDEPIIKFSDIKEVDSNWYNYIIRDCIM